LPARQPTQQNHEQVLLKIYFFSLKFLEQLFDKQINPTIFFNDEILVRIT